MLTEIIVLPRFEAVRFCSAQPWAAVQITGAGRDWAELGEANRVAVLRLSFADRVARTRPELGESFSAEQADQILDFVAAHRASVGRLLIHCDAGLSRSPAVAAALTRVFLPEADWFGYFGRYVPNQRVYETLVAAAARRGLLDGE